GADANTSMPEGETALMTAARTGRIEAVKTLLGHGAAVNAKENWHGQTALMWAAAEGYPDVVRALVAAGADVHMPSNGRFTALLFAAREGRIGAVQALAASGADMNDALPVRTRQPSTAAAAAAPTARSEVGLNAFLLAAANAHYELAAWFLDHGADPNAAPQ